MGRSPNPGTRHGLYGDGTERSVLGTDRGPRTGFHDLEARRARADQPEDDSVLGYLYQEVRPHAGCLYQLRDL